ncbi:MAG: hypothetical protein ACKO4Z_14120 [Planctomycetota bacterium]
MSRLYWLGAVVVAAVSVQPCLSAEWGFVRCDGTTLRDDAGPVRFVSFNVPNLLIIEDAFGWGRASPWRWPDDFELTDAFRALRQMGGTVARSYVITVRRDDSDMGPFVHVTGPGEFNEEAFVAMDRMLAAAARERVRVIVPLVDNWKWQGGAPQYAGFRGKPPEAFWTDRQVIDDFKRTIAHVLGRTNTVTGMAYAADPAIFGWETGNELDAPAAWTREIARAIHELDPNHLVIDGNSLHGVPEASLAMTEVDVVTTHHYPGDGVDMTADVAKAIAVAAGRKPFFVGEAGFVPLTEIRGVVERVRESAAAGVLLWSLRFRSRDGGFYWHSEPACQGRYKAFHWPGFPSGDAYEEQPLFTFVHDRAHRIRGLVPPRAPVPETPSMLPTIDPAAISWRGSVGATRYVLERAPTDAGPWQVVAANAREDHRQYRPLFADESAEPERPWWYRVAAVNASGTSAASQPVGPARSSQRILVDELDDLSRVADPSPGVEIVTANARAAQEDAFRALLKAGSRIAYRVGGPIASVHVRAFADDPGATLAVSLGSATAGPTPGRRSGEAGGDYGYLVPLEFDARADGTEADGVTLTAGDRPLQVSRVEIRYHEAPGP